MADKHPSGEQIQSMLREGHFGQSRELPPADPLTVTQMLLEIDRIEPYDHNPRKERNPLYDEIKASVRAQGGLNNPLTVTRRPGDPSYIVESGGNTRLQILKELWRETGDERFFRIHCLFRPWVSESHVLTAHLIENDTRGALTFIDKALGVRALRQVLESEHDESLSQRQLVEALRERGYALDQSSVSRMDYAVDVLLPVIPEALRTGMGAPQVRRVRRLETACRSLWDEQPAAEDDHFEALFQEALATHDGPHWDLEAVQQALETRLAELTGLSLKQVRLEVDARLATGSAEPATSEAKITEARSAPTTPTTDTSARPPPASAEPEPEDASEPRSVLETESASDDPGCDAPLETPNTSAPESETAAVPTSADAGLTDLKSLRSRGYVLALKIAQRHDLADCITPAGGLGMGFLVDLPREPLVPVEGQDDALRQLYRQWAWWLLLSLSEESVQPERMVQDPEELLLRNLVLEGNDAQALTLVGEPDWKALGYQWLSNPSVPPSSIDDLLALVQTCRHIRQLTGDDGELALWQSEE